MGEYAARKLRERGYQIHLETPIREVREGGVVIGEDEFVPSRTVIWTGGVRPAPIVGEAGIDVDKAGRAVVSATMETSRAGRVGDGRLRAHPERGRGGVVPRADRPERGP